MKTAKRALSIVLVLLCLASVLSVGASAATKYKSYGCKYGDIIPVKADYKTICENYTVKGENGALHFSFVSKGYEKNVYYGIMLFSDKEMQNILVNICEDFPVVDSSGSITLDFSPLQSGVYYGITYTCVAKGEDIIIDRDSIHTYTVTLNKVGSATTKITKAQALYTGNYIAWDSVEYADGYYVYRKQADTSWEKLIITNELSYLDKTAVRGEKYYYTVRAYDESGSYRSKYNTKGVPVIYLAPPVLEGEPQLLADNGVKISWQAVSGADKYSVYRKAPGGSYTRLAVLDADITEYTDTTAKSDGDIFIYAVRAHNETNVGVLATTSEFEIFGTFKPDAYCESNTVFVSWDEVDNVQGYTLFKKQGDGEWQMILGESTETSFFDEDIVAGEKYSYSLVAHRDGEVSSFDTKGVSVYCLSEPAISSVGTTVKDSVLVKWGKVEGATSYNIYRKSPVEGYKLVGNTTLCSFYDTTAKANNLIHTYYVEAVASNSTSQSGNNTKSILYMAAPKLSSVKWDGDGNEVKWGRVAGATAYRVYRRTPTGSYKCIATVSGALEFVDTTAKKNAQYYYTVTALNGKTRGAYEIGKGVNCLDAPIITKVTANNDNSLTVKWNKVQGAAGYYVYRKAEGGDWTRLAKTASLSYKDTSKKVSGTNYIYTVKAYNKNGKGIHDTIGYKALYLTNPVITELARQDDGTVNILWKAVDGAAAYRVYRKTEGSGWTILDASTTARSFVDTTAQSDTAYYYTVKALNNSYSSGYTAYKLK